MLGHMLTAQMKQSNQSTQLRSWAIAVLLVFAAIWAIRRPASVPGCIELASWTLFLTSVVVGGGLTGWRVTQFTKTRAAEFYLVAPLSDWTLILGEVLGGALQTLMVLVATLPIVAAMYGAGWVDPAQAFGLITIPIAFGWLVGIALATVAYSPVWLRKLGEHIAMVFLLAYFILFGLVGHYFVPWFVGWLSQMTQTPLTVLTQFDQSLRYVNPFRLVGAIGRESGEAFFLQVLTVFGVLLGFSLLGVWYLVRRLRKHYLEENYSNQNREQKSSRPIRENPLAWWTHRRVSQFRGQINIYLGWGCVLLYSLWVAISVSQGAVVQWMIMAVFYFFGGSAMIGAFGLQFGLVSTAFLNGLWDSNTQQRVSRLELLLVSPLTAREFLGGSIAAAWTRGKHYFAMAVVAWGVPAALTVIVPLFRPVSRSKALATLAPTSIWAFLFAMFVAAVYVFFVFSIAFRNFARLKGDNQVARLGLLLSLGIPLLTSALFFLNLGWLGALVPLGAVFLLTSDPAWAAESTGLSWEWMWLMIFLATGCYLWMGRLLFQAAFKNFDQEIRTWFALHLISPEARKKLGTAQTSEPSKKSQTPLQPLSETTA